jgi:hypothetical protein
MIDSDAYIFIGERLFCEQKSSQKGSQNNPPSYFIVCITCIFYYITGELLVDSDVCEMIFTP